MLFWLLTNSTNSFISQMLVGPGTGPLLTPDGYKTKRQRGDFPLHSRCFDAQEQSISLCHTHEFWMHHGHGLLCGHYKMPFPPSYQRQWCYVSRGRGKHLLSCAEEQGDVIEFTVARWRKATCSWQQIIHCHGGWLSWGKLRQLYVIMWPCYNKPASNSFKYGVGCELDLFCNQLTIEPITYLTFKHI